MQSPMPVVAEQFVKVGLLIRRDMVDERNVKERAPPVEFAEHFVNEVDPLMVRAVVPSN